MMKKINTSISNKKENERSLGEKKKIDRMVHCHGHSEFSSLDGFTKIEALVERVKSIGQPAVALTDHGVLNGSYKFYKECKKQNIFPILGIEAYCVKKHEKVQSMFHITLLAKNNEGWKNLLRLHKISYNNFYYKQRIDFQDLFNHKEGLICLSGCLSGILSKHIRKGNLLEAEENLLLFSGEFKDDFYIEIMSHNLDFQEEINHNLRQLAKKYEISCVGTNDYHYPEKKDHIYQSYLMCDNMKTTIHDEKVIGLTTEEFYIKTREEMPCTEEEKDNTLEIYEKCLKDPVEIKFKGFLLPVEEEQESRLISLIDKGFELKKIPRTEEYLSRLREEYRIIRKAKLIGYFLTVQDYIEWAENQGILIGPGRGSVGGCLIGYLIGIHNVDPIKHKLLFSRFYNEGRKGSLPDVDTDFPENKINEVRQYIKNKYSKDKVAHIGTFNYLQEKSSLKLVCRVLGIDFKLANYYSSIIEDEKQVEYLKKTDSGFRDIWNKAKEFHKLAVHSSIHAAGIIISPSNLDELVPLRLNKDNDLYVSAWDMKDIEDIGLIKFDLLSLNTLDVISDTLNAINLNIRDIPTEDSNTFELISNTSNIGVFQLGSDGISKVANDMNVESIDDIAVVVALYRPGPISSGLHTKYINRKNGSEPVEYAHSLLKEVLDDTYGIFVYQEQIIKAAMVLANFSETEADSLRKAIGKKMPELMKKQKKQFIDGCLTNKVDKKTAKELWDEIEEFSLYCFNASHSVGYAYISYYTAYLKTHYPHEFMASLLNNNYDRRDKLANYLKECNRMGIEVVPPSVVDGNYNFISKDNKIIFGLKGIVGIGEKTAKKIYEKSYKNFEDFCSKFQPSSDVIVPLAEAGVFDEFGYKRNEILQSAEHISTVIKSRKKIINPSANLLFDNKLNFNIVKVEELPNEILAAKEHDRLNTYLVYNPLKGIDLETPDTLEGKVFIEGYIINIKEHLTKKKQIMAFMSIATNLGEIECIMFPHNYRKKKDIIRKNTYIAIDGQFEDKLIINNIWRKKIDRDNDFFV